MACRHDEDTLIKQLSDLKVTAEERACTFKLKEEHIYKTEKKLEHALFAKF